MTRTLILKSVAHIRAANAVSTGLGLWLGLVLANYLFQTISPPIRATRQLIICLNCRSRNPAENSYCWQCGHAFSPIITAQCDKCKARVPSMPYCGNCGAKLRKATENKEGVCG